MNFFRPQTIFYGDTYPHINHRPNEAGPHPGRPNINDLNNDYTKHKLPYLPYKYPYKYQYGRHVASSDFTVPCPTCEPYEDNRSKLPRFLLPWPLTLYTKDLQRPFPDNSAFILTPILLIPFIPFGLAEFSLPIGWDANYIVERYSKIIKLSNFIQKANWDNNIVL